MVPYDKWIDGISAEDTVDTVVQQSLRVRLAAVQHYLPLAAEQAEADVEYVHKLRVSTRRAKAVLVLFADRLPKKESRWFRKILRRIRRAGQKARDMDVLALSHAGDEGKGAAEFLELVARQRRRAQKPLIHMHRQLDADDALNRHTDRLLDQVAERTRESSSEPFRPWAVARLRKSLKRFRKASPHDLRDVAALHRFRIRGKQLRYAMELLAPAFPDTFRSELYPLIEQLQERLGQINDRVVARERFVRWAAQRKRQKAASHARRLLDREGERLESLLDEFARWWTPGFQQRVWDGFEQMLTTASAPVPALRLRG